MLGIIDKKAITRHNRVVNNVILLPFVMVASVDVCCYVVRYVQHNTHVRTDILEFKELLCVKDTCIIFLHVAKTATNTSHSDDEHK